MDLYSFTATLPGTLLVCLHRHCNLTPHFPHISRHTFLTFHSTLSVFKHFSRSVLNYTDPPPHLYPLSFYESLCVKLIFYFKRCINLAFPSNGCISAVLFSIFCQSSLNSLLKPCIDLPRF